MKITGKSIDLSRFLARFRVPSEEALTGHTNGTPGFEEGSKRAQLFNTETRKVLHNNSLGGAVSAVVLGRNTLYTHAALLSKV